MPAFWRKEKAEAGWTWQGVKALRELLMLTEELSFHHNIS